MRPSRFPPSLRSAPHEIRLIGGRLKRSKLPVLDRPGLRPTPDRVRETLFNWLGQDLSGWRVLDVFAGSGALGLEAASRGARDVQLLERDPRLVASLRATCARLQATQVQVEPADSMAWMARVVGIVQPFDLVLLDPPFDADLYEPALRAAKPLLAAEGLVYLEADRPFSDTALAALGWRLLRAGRAGAVHFHLLGRAEQASD